MKKKRYLGGLRLGNSQMDSVNISYPFANLQTLSDHVIIKYKFFWGEKEITLKRNEIIKMEHVKLLFSKGIRIYHTSLLFPQYIVFFTFSSSLLFEALQIWLTLHIQNDHLEQGNR